MLNVRLSAKAQNLSSIANILKIIASLRFPTHIRLQQFIKIQKPIL